MPCVSEAVTGTRNSSRRGRGARDGCVEGLGWDSRSSTTNFIFTNHSKQTSKASFFLAIAIAPPRRRPLSHLNGSMTTKESADAGNKEEKFRNIPFSDVVVKPRKRAYWKRKWSLDDVIRVVVMSSMHVLALFAPFYFTWGALRLAIALYTVSGLFGVTLSYHRQLSHGAFKLRPKWIEYLFAYFALHAGQGGPIEWVSNHRFHHKHSDTEKDVHSPLEGFWFSHINWIFNDGYIAQKCGQRSNVEDIRKQWFYRFLEVTSLFHPLALGVLLYNYGGFHLVVWGMGVRITWGYHMTFLVNSACHVWGTQAWNTGDLSRNNWLVTLFVFGEGWHNNHHAFENSARHGIEWWQIDMTWYVISTLEYLGLAYDVKVPSAVQKQRLSFKLGSEGAKVLPEMHNMSFSSKAE